MERELSENLLFNFDTLSIVENKPAPRNDCSYIPLCKTKEELYCTVLFLQISRELFWPKNATPIAADVF